MDRYTNVARLDGKLKTIKFPVIVPSEDDTIVISRDSERLDTLAQEYYGDQSLYWIIGLANNLGKGSVEITPGTTIRIPYNQLKILRDYINLNS